jgi:hypothetical protein
MPIVGLLVSEVRCQIEEVVVVKLFISSLMLVLFCVSACAQAKTLEDWKGIYETESGKIEARYKESADAALARYTEDLTAIKTQYKRSGDLDGSLAIRREQERFETEKSVPDDDAANLPSLIQKARGAHRKVIAAANAARAKQLSALTKRYVRRLDTMKRRLVMSEELDAATAVDTEIKRVSFIAAALTAELPTTAPAGEKQPSSGKKRPSAAELLARRKEGAAKPVNPFKDPKWGTSMTIPAGRYRIGKDRITVKQTEKGASKPEITFEEGAEIRDGTIFVDEGKISGKGATFEDVVFSVDLGGMVVMEDCVFEDCSMRKGGAWFAGWSSKWVFDNCVFDGKFFDGWTTGNVGIEVRNCTFHKVDFPTFNYKGDAGAEAQHSWRTLDECLFRKCEVPMSVVAATKDSVFDGCKIVADPRDYDYKTPVAVSMTVLNGKGKMPPTPPNVTLNTSSTPAESGSTLKHDLR